MHHDDYTTPPVPPEVMGAVNGDSSTEDEADPARYAAPPVKQNGVHHRRVVSQGSVRLEAGTAPQFRHLPHHRELYYPDAATLYANRNGHPAPCYGRSVYTDLRHSPEFGTRDAISPINGSALAAERAHLPQHVGLPPPSARLVYPAGRQWSPYESRTIYSHSPAPAGVPYHRSDERRNSEDLGQTARPSPPLRSSVFRRSQGEIVKGLPPPGPDPGGPYAHSPIYDAPQHAYYAHPHRSYQQQHPSLRALEGEEPGSPYYSAASYSHLARSR